jgi:hypothetical protein
MSAPMSKGRSIINPRIVSPTFNSWFCAKDIANRASGRQAGRCRRRRGDAVIAGFGYGIMYLARPYAICKGFMPFDPVDP